jgi:hypothetical protein
LETVGQDFAEAIFRVFSDGHPEALLHIENVSAAVSAMIRHVQSGPAR